MPKLIQKIYSSAQSGKTLAAASLVHGYWRNGIPAALIAPTQDTATVIAVRYGIPKSHCYGWSLATRDASTLSRYQAIVIDEAGRIDQKEGDPVDLLQARFATYIVPFPAIVGFYTDHSRRRKGADHAIA